MSRTPLFRLLHRSYRAAPHSIAHAEPIEEVLDRLDACAPQSSLDFLLMIDPEPDPLRMFGESAERYHVHAGTTATATQVLVAIPFTLLRDVRTGVDRPPEKRRAIAELGYGTNAKPMVGFSSRLWRDRSRSNRCVLTDLPFHLTGATSRLGMKQARSHWPTFAAKEIAAARGQRVGYGRRFEPRRPLAVAS